MCNPQLPWCGFWLADIVRALELFLKLQQWQIQRKWSIPFFPAWRIPLFPIHSPPPVDPVLSLLMRKTCAPSNLSAIVHVQSSLSPDISPNSVEILQCNYLLQIVSQWQMDPFHLFHVQMFSFTVRFWILMGGKKPQSAILLLFSREITHLGVSFLCTKQYQLHVILHI